MIALIVAATVSFAAAQGPEGGDKQRFMDEAPTAWEKYAERGRRIQGSYTLTNRSLPANKVVLQSRVEFKQAEGCYLILDQGTLKPSLDGELHAVNPHYCFSLKRKAADGPWTVARVGANLWKPSSLDHPSQPVESILRSPYTLIRITESMKETLLDSVFAIGKVSQLEREGEQLYKVEFRYRPAKNAITTPPCSGWVLLDPKRHWVIRELDANVKFSGDLAMHYRVHYQYLDASGGFPILKQTVGIRKNLANDRSIEETCAYDLEERDVPEREFRLTCFGFSDPPGVPSPDGSRWYLWFIAAAVVSLGVGWYFFRRLRKAPASLATRPAKDHRGIRP